MQWEQEFKGKKLFEKLRALDVVVWSVPGFYPHTEKQRALGSGRLPQSVRVNGVLLPNVLAFILDNSFLVFAQLLCQHQTPAGFSHQSFPTVAAGQDTSGNTLWVCFLSVAEASPWLPAVCSEHVRCSPSRNMPVSGFQVC